MNNLDSALAELAHRLGVSVSELWTWLTSVGFQSYIRLKIANDAVALIAAVVLVMIMIFIARWGYKKNQGLASWARSAGFDAIMLASIVVAVIGLIVALVSLTSLVEWVVSPEGRLIDMIIDMAK